MAPLIFIIVLSVLDVMRINIIIIHFSIYAIMHASINQLC